MFWDGSKGGHFCQPGGTVSRGTVTLFAIYNTVLGLMPRLINSHIWTLVGLMTHRMAGVVNDSHGSINNPHSLSSIMTHIQYTPLTQVNPTVWILMLASHLPPKFWSWKWSRMRFRNVAKTDASTVVLRIVNPQPHITAHYAVVKACKHIRADRRCTKLSLWLFSDRENRPSG